MLKMKILLFLLISAELNLVMINSQGIPSSSGSSTQFAQPPSAFSPDSSLSGDSPPQSQPGLPAGQLSASGLSASFDPMREPGQLSPSAPASNPSFSFGPLPGTLVYPPSPSVPRFGQPYNYYPPGVPPPYYPPQFYFQLQRPYFPPYRYGRRYGGRNRRLRYGRIFFT
ncbi:unnamed protein product [Heterobilharzia americana]|nr:unnamed protein product [Heterobilharzia americana]